MINWNPTDARQVERLSDLFREDDEQTVIKPSSFKAPLNPNPGDDEKSVRAIALLVAIALSAVLAIWRNPESMLWWLLALFALSSWCCALGTFISDIVKVAIEWIVEALAYLRDILAGWRDATRRFIDHWIWSRFHAKQTERESYVKHT